MEQSLLRFTVFLSVGIMLLLTTTEAAKSCVSCFSMENIVGPASMKEVLKTYNQPSCWKHITDANRTGIEICESSNKIYETITCGILDGFVNGTAFGRPMNMKLFYRGCIAVRSQSNPVYQCQNVDNNQLDLQQNLAKVFRPIQDYTLKHFEGQRCLCESNSCETSAASWSQSFQWRLWILTTFFSFSAMIGW